MEKGNEYLISVQNRAQNSVIENDIETAQPTAYLNVPKQVQDPFSKTENSYSSGSSFSPIVMDFYTLGMCYQEARTVQQRGTLEKPIEITSNQSKEKNHHLAMQKMKQSENE
jgi:hypothetical protein